MENLAIIQLLKHYRRKFQLENHNNLDRIKDLEYTIGMSLDEFKELNSLYDIYFDNLTKINLLNEILNAIE